jgi:hypothetical protein
MPHYRIYRLAEDDHIVSVRGVDAATDEEACLAAREVTEAIRGKRSLVGGSLCPQSFGQLAGQRNPHRPNTQKVD